MTNEADKLATQMFVIRNVLTTHTYKVLDPATIEKILKKLEAEIQSGACSWAF